MSELIRSIAARLREFVGNLRHAPRHKVRLPFSISLLEMKTGTDATRRSPKIEGHTRDISATGMALVVPAIRIGEHYLTGEGNILRLRLESPPGPVQMNVTPERYEQLDESEAERGFLIGVSITQISDRDRARFISYLRTLR